MSPFLADGATRPPLCVIEQSCSAHKKYWIANAMPADPETSPSAVAALARLAGA